MGLDDFQTQSSTSSKSSQTSQNKKKKSIEDNSPYFCVVVRDETGEVGIFDGDEAFCRLSRHKGETFITSLETEEEYEELKEISEEVNGLTPHELFKQMPSKGADLANRVNRNRQSSKTEECEVCGDKILTEREKYITVDDIIVHSHHTVENVAETLES